MKFKFWDFEYDFDKEDAIIVVPLILLFLALKFTTYDAGILIVIFATYYFLYFFAEKIFQRMKDIWIKLVKLRCPKCKSRKIILQGYQGYKSDEQYAYYFCNQCKSTSIMIETGLMEI